jgi:hypothetical protein
MKLMSVILVALGSFTLAAIAAAQEKKEETPVIPEAVAKAVGEYFPKAEIANVEAEDESGVTVYDIEFKAGRGETEIAADGTVMEITTIVEMDSLDDAVAAVIRKAAEGAALKQIEMSQIRAEVRKEKDKALVVKLDSPLLVYEAELQKGEQIGEIQVAPDGKIVEPLKWSGKGSEKD